MARMLFENFKIESLTGVINLLSDDLKVYLTNVRPDSSVHKYKNELPEIPGGVRIKINTTQVGNSGVVVSADRDQDIYLVMYDDSTLEKVLIWWAAISNEDFWQWGIY